jgi:hypothetical protein
MMSPHSRRVPIAVTAVAVVAITRASLPALLTWLANFALRRLPGIRGRVRQVRMNFIAPALAVRGLSLTKLNGTAPAHRIELSSILVTSEWKSLLTAPS